MFSSRFCAVTMISSTPARVGGAAASSASTGKTNENDTTASDARPREVRLMTKSPFLYPCVSMPGTPPAASSAANFNAFHSGSKPLAPKWGSAATKVLLLAVGLLCGAVGCSTTSLTDSWQSPNLHRAQMDRVLVVAVTGNPTYRVLFERSFVNALKEKGIGATASIDVIGNNMPTREAVMSYLKKGDARYVSVTRYGGSQITQEVVP